MRKSVYLLLSTLLIGIFISGCATQKAVKTTPITTPSGADSTSGQTGSVAQPVTGQSVVISNFTYQPSELTVKAGETVTWTNQDSMAHTVTSDSGTELDSDLFGQGETYSHTFMGAGEYPYYCKPHPWMKGKIIVIE